MDQILPISLILLYATAFLAPTVHRLVGGRSHWLLALAPCSVFVALLTCGGDVHSGEVIAFTYEWFEELGISFSLRMDGLSYLMASLITGIGTLIVIYAGGYMHGHPQLGRFYLYLLSFMGAMLGLVLSDNLILLFVFWELTSITSYLLIGFNHEKKDSRWKALQALLVTGLGAMAMMAGFILLAQVAGTYSISEINSLGDLLHTSPLYTAIVILVLVGAFTKSAQFPFHFWLPNAMAGPTPVSAYLHSATMVKAGIYLMARMNPSLGGSELWGNTLSIFGGITLLLAVFLGLFQKDVKTILAYTTLGVLGLLTMLLGIGTDYAMKAMVVFLIGHALYKATLFMVAGSIDHETGTRDVLLLRGLRGLMPITALAGVLAALSMSGLPPFFGFIGKELIYKAGVGLSGIELSLLVVALLGNLLMMGLALNAGVGPFFGKPNHAALPKKPHEAPVSMWLGPILLGFSGLIFGILPFLISGAFVAPAVASILGGSIHALDLALWHIVKPNLPLLLSCVTIAGGAVIFVFRHKFWLVADRLLAAMRPIGAEAMYDRIFSGIVQFSKVQTRWLQTGKLHDYVFMILTASLLMTGWGIFRFGISDIGVDFSDFSLLITLLTVIMMAATIVAVVSTNYMMILAALGTVGFGIAVIFGYYSAPDLAITQLMVETLTVVLFMFVLIHLPKLRLFSSKGKMRRDTILSIAAGITITVLLIASVNIQMQPSIAYDLAEMSYPLAKGKNVVNVILVDFRALDTLGEIVVISAASLGITALVAVTVVRKRASK